MKNSLKLFLTGVFLTMATSFSISAGTNAPAKTMQIRWERLPDLPAPAAGQTLLYIRNTLYAIGGTCWIDGKKVYLDRILKLDPDKYIWEDAGKLPFPLGYAFGVVKNDRMILIGGAAADNKSTGMILVSDDYGKSWQSFCCDNTPGFGASYCFDGVSVYGFGGMPAANRWRNLSGRCWKLDLSKAGFNWEEHPFHSGKTVALASSAADSGNLFYAGGADEKIVNSNEFWIRRGGIWRRGCDLPAGIRAGVLHILPGDRLLLFAQCLTEPEKNTKVTDKIYSYDMILDKWQLAASAPEKAVFDILRAENEIYLVGGEDKGGSRIGSVYRGIIHY